MTQIKLSFSDAEKLAEALRAKETVNPRVAMGALMKTTDAAGDLLEVVEIPMKLVSQHLQATEHPAADSLAKYHGAVQTTLGFLSLTRCFPAFNGSATEKASAACGLAADVSATALAHAQLAGRPIEGVAAETLGHVKTAGTIASRFLGGCTNVANLWSASRRIKEAQAVLKEAQVSEKDLALLQKEAANATEEEGVTLSEEASDVATRLQQYIAPALDTSDETKVENGKAIVSALRKLHNARTECKDNALSLVGKVGVIALAVLGIAAVSALVPTGVLVPLVAALGLAVASLSLYRLYQQKAHKSLIEEDQKLPAFPTLSQAPETATV